MAVAFSVTYSCMLNYIPNDTFRLHALFTFKITTMKSMMLNVGMVGAAASAVASTYSSQ